MEILKERIRKELNTYQFGVARRLEELQKQGLISPKELKRISIEAQITGKAILEGLSSQGQYTEETIEIHIYQLFDRYKSKIESEIKSIELQQYSCNISIKGKPVVLSFENEKGQLINPIQMEKEIIENFLSDSLISPVKKVEVVANGMTRDIRLELYKQSKNNDLAREKFIKEVYKNFGAVINQVVSGEYSEEAKEKSKYQLIKDMKDELAQKIPEKKSFWRRIIT
ncbi:MAG: hypothetical protein WA865_15345 [Spirulinaceae cyanobacterium]